MFERTSRDSRAASVVGDLLKPKLVTSRRGLIRAAAQCAAIGVAGSVAGAERQALAASTDRKFLYFFARGGWDATPLDPKFAGDGFSAVGGTDMDAGTVLGQQGNLSWSSGPDRLAMDAYFAAWGHRSAIIRGVNVHSVAHDTGEYWALTGGGINTRPDWPTILAAGGATDYPMPHLVFSGPNYPGRLGSAVVRGGGGSLLDLIDGSIMGYSDQNAPAFELSVDAMIDAHVRTRAVRYGVGRTGLAKIRTDAFSDSLDRSTELEGRQFEAGLAGAAAGTLDQALMALEVMRLGLTRCAMIEIPGGWDTHGGNGAVGGQLDDFFSVLDELQSHMARTPGLSSEWLADEVVIAAGSELGRTPKFNGAMGRDHWTYTSMFLAGAGIQGDTVAGATDESLLGVPIDLGTGRASNSGVMIGTEHVGATLLELGNVDPEEFLPGVPSIRALIQGA